MTAGKLILEIPTTEEQLADLEDAKLSNKYLPNPPGEERDVSEEGERRRKKPLKAIPSHPIYLDLDPPAIASFATQIALGQQALLKTKGDAPFWVKRASLRSRPLERLLSLEESELHWGSWNFRQAAITPGYVALALKFGKMRVLRQMNEDRLLFRQPKQQAGMVSDCSFSKHNVMVTVTQAQSRVWVQHLPEELGEKVAYTCGGLSWASTPYVPRHVEWHPMMDELFCVSLSHTDPSMEGSGYLVGGGFAVIDSSKLRLGVGHTGDRVSEEFLHTVTMTKRPSSGPDKAPNYEMDHDSIQYVGFGHAAEINSIKFHPNVPIMLTGGADGKVGFWCVGDKDAERRMTLDPGKASKWIPPKATVTNAFYVDQVMTDVEGVETVFFTVVSDVLNRTIIQVWSVDWDMRTLQPYQDTQKLKQVINLKNPHGNQVAKPAHVGVNCVDFSKRCKMMVVSSWVRMSLLLFQFENGRYVNVREVLLREPALSVVVCEDLELGFNIYVKGHKTIHAYLWSGEEAGESTSKNLGDGKGLLDELLSHHAKDPVKLGLTRSMAPPIPEEDSNTTKTTLAVNSSLVAPTIAKRTASDQATIIAEVASAVLPSSASFATQPSVSNGNRSFSLDSGTRLSSKLIDIDDDAEVSAPQTTSALLLSVLSGAVELTNNSAQERLDRLSGLDGDLPPITTSTANADGSHARSMFSAPISSAPIPGSLQETSSRLSHQPKSAEPKMLDGAPAEAAQAKPESTESLQSQQAAPCPSESDANESSTPKKRRREKRKNKDKESKESLVGENAVNRKSAEHLPTNAKTSSRSALPKTPTPAMAAPKKIASAESRSRKSSQKKGLFSDGEAGTQTFSYNQATVSTQNANTFPGDSGPSAPPLPFASLAPPLPSTTSGLQFDPASIKAAATAAVTASTATMSDGLADKITTAVDERLRTCLPNYFEQLYAKLEKDRMVGQSVESAKQEQLLRVISDSLKNNTTRVLEEAVHEEIEHHLLPKVMESVVQVVYHSLAQMLQNNDTVKMMITQNLQEVLLPTYQKTTQAMFEGVQRTFESGINQLMQNIEKAIASQMIPRFDGAIAEFKDHVQAQKKELNAATTSLQQVLRHIQQPNSSGTSLLKSSMTPQAEGPSVPSNPQWPHAHQQSFSQLSLSTRPGESPAQRTMSPLHSSSSAVQSPTKASGLGGSHDLLKLFQQQIEQHPARNALGLEKITGGTAAPVRQRQLSDPPFQDQAGQQISTNRTEINIGASKADSNNYLANVKRKDLIDGHNWSHHTSRYQLATQQALYAGDDRALVQLAAAVPAEHVVNDISVPSSALIQVIPKIAPYIARYPNIASWIQAIILSVDLRDSHVAKHFRAIVEDAIKYANQDQTSPTSALLVDFLRNALNGTIRDRVQ